MKSWKTTTLGIISLIICALLVRDIAIREAWHFWRYWIEPFGFFAVGVMGICARDHTHKDDCGR